MLYFKLTKNKMTLIAYFILTLASTSYYDISNTRNRIRAKGKQGQK